MATVYIIFYSMYSHVYTMAQEVQAGLEAQGVTVKLFQVPETLSADVLEKMHAPPKPDVPIITPEQLEEADGIIWGIPVRFGQAAAQMLSFFDATGSLWAKGALAGKPTSIFFSSGSQHGGQETLAFNTLPYFAHHGLLYVPLGFANPNLFDNSGVVGGSAWGSGTVAGPDGMRQPSDQEKAIARTQGENFATLVNTLTKGRALVKEDAEKKQDSAPKSTIKQDNEINTAEETNGTTTKPLPATKTAAQNEKKPSKAKKFPSCICM
ncbi:flavoprotein-like protein [Gongronella butleri]|nr:flavoprotein-like protein [Gongronella butleri]